MSNTLLSPLHHTHNYYTATADPSSVAYSLIPLISKGKVIRYIVRIPKISTTRNWLPFTAKIMNLF